jgi:homoserine kinase
MNEITIRVPATTANLGPGYDCLGVALKLYNYVTVARGETAEIHPMAVEAGGAFFAKSGATPFPFTWRIEGDVPQSRGLGSSVTVRMGLLHGLNGLSESALTMHGRLGAAESCANACRITAAFFQQKYELLRGSFSDHLHQPFREPLIPFLSRVIAAGESAGALAGFLSGSGSAICCLTLENPEAVAAAMLESCELPGARTVVTSADNTGVRTVSPADRMPLPLRVSLPYA